EQIEALERIGEALGGEAYFLETIFNPLSIAADMTANEQQILDDRRDNPQALKDALEVITETVTHVAAVCIKSGPVGISFATSEARLAREQTGGRRWMLGPACSMPVDCPEQNVRAARDAADVLQGLL